MKKFLTVLLALSVVFTYSFSAVGTAFADTSYTRDDYKTRFADEWTKIYEKDLSAAAEKYVDSLTFSGDVVLYDNNTTTVKASDLGIKVSPAPNYYTEDAVRKMIATIQADVSTAIQQYTESTIDSVFGSADTTTVDPATYSIGDATVYGNSLDDIVYDYQVATNATVNSDKWFIEQANGIYEGILAALNAISLDDYTAENAATISEAKVEVSKKIDEIEKGTLTGWKKTEAFINAYGAFKAVLDKTPTIEDSEYDDTNTEASVAAAVAKYVEYGLNDVYGAYKVVANEPIAAHLLTPDNKYLYEKGTGNSATIFGVKVANVNSPTVAEATAVNKAMRAAYEDAAKVVKAYGMSVNGDKVDAIEKLYFSPTTGKASAKYSLASLNKVAEAIDVYADVVAEGEAMKAAYKYGVKVYNDANVDAAVKEAEALVYADLGAAKFDDAANYITAAAKKLGIILEAENFEYQAFVKAIAAAQAKFFKADGKPQIKVLSGENKTPEEDLVYLKSTYATCEAGAWQLIAENACKAIANAETYADIDAALADAADALSELMLAKDEIAVTAAIDRYVEALKDDQKAAEDVMGLKDYIQASYDDAYEAGKALIEEADTLEEASAAYAEAVALFKTIPTKAELDAAHNAVYEQIKALPAISTLTANDQETVVAVMNAYLDYAAMYGSNPEGIYNRDTLDRALDTVLKLASKDLQAKVDDMVKALEKNKASTDNGAAALVAMKSDVEALISEAYAFNALLVEADGVVALPDLKATDYTIVDIDKLEKALDSEDKIWQAELHNLLVLANTADTVAEKKAVLEAYEKLTDRQKYKMEQNLKTLIEEIKADLISSVTSLKLTASSTAAKGSITVKWTVKGDYAAADGYRVYKSKKMNSGYGTKPYFTTKDSSKMSYKNTKELKKGTRYYYKVRAFVIIDGKTYFSDYSNKAYRIAK